MQCSLNFSLVVSASQSARVVSYAVLSLQLLLLFPACSSQTLFSAEADFTEQQRSLFSLLAERLSHMESVARYKAENDLAIEDRAREAQVIAAATREAIAAGLDAEQAANFFQAQITVAKAIQYRSRADLLSQAGRPPAKIDLQRTIRPELDRLGTEIVELLAAAVSGDQVAWSRSLFDETLLVPYVSEADRELLFKALPRRLTANRP